MKRMNNLFDKIGNDLKNFSPEAPAYMEERVHKAVMSQKAKVRFWFSLNAVLLLVGLAAAGIFGLVYFKGDAAPMASAVPATATPTVATEAVMPKQNLGQATVASLPTGTKSKGNFSERRTVTTPVIKENCGGTPEVVEVQENSASVDSSVHTEAAVETKVEEVVKSTSQETPAKKRRSLPITRYHK